MAIRRKKICEGGRETCRNLKGAEQTWYTAHGEKILITKRERKKLFGLSNMRAFRHSVVEPDLDPFRAVIICLSGAGSGPKNDIGSPD